ncbi:MAG: carbohydrate porin, partial [Prochlorococcus sp.]
LQWEDAFAEGNVLGAAVGQPTFVTDIEYDDDTDVSDFVADGNYAFELWYKFQVTDNISVTPAIYYLSRPLGELTDGGGPTGLGRGDDTFNNFGGLVKTTFRF